MLILLCLTLLCHKLRMILTIIVLSLNHYQKVNQMLVKKVNFMWNCFWNWLTIWVFWHFHRLSINVRICDTITICWIVCSNSRIRIPVYICRSCPIATSGGIIFVDASGSTTWKSRILILCSIIYWWSSTIFQSIWGSWCSYIWLVSIWRQLLISAISRGCCFACSTVTTTTYSWSWIHL